jgi:MFS family permease
LLTITVSSAIFSDACSLTRQAIILSDLVSPADRGLYQGGGSVLFGAGSAAGAVIGGAVAEEWGWRGAFWIQAPPILLAIVIVIWQIDLEEPTSDRSMWQRFREVDWAGSGLIMLSVSAESRLTVVAYSNCRRYRA